MIWRHRESEPCRPGFNIATGERLGVEVIVYWRGFVYAYIIRLRVRPRGWPREAKRIILGARRVCHRCDYMRAEYCPRHRTAV